MLSVEAIEKKILDCLSEYGELVNIEPTDGSDKDLIEIDFEPINPDASGGSFQIFDVRNRRPWVTLSAGVGLKFEWYDGCDYPDVCHFIHAIASGNVQETVFRWHARYAGGSGYIEIDGNRYESSRVLGFRYFLGKVTKKINKTEVQYEPWE